MKPSRQDNPRREDKWWYIDTYVNLGQLQSLQKGQHSTPGMWRPIKKRGRLIYFSDTSSIISPEDTVHSGSVQTPWSGFLNVFSYWSLFAWKTLFPSWICFGFYSVWIVSLYICSCVFWNHVQSASGGPGGLRPRCRNITLKLITRNGTAESLNAEYIDFGVVLSPPAAPAKGRTLDFKKQQQQ